MEAAIAQLGERQTEDLKVPGSIPGGGTFFFFTFESFQRSKKIHPPGIEPGTYRVLGGRHNQLDHGCVYVQYPGFEPGLPRPQRGVLTTILILPGICKTFHEQYR